MVEAFDGITECSDRHIITLDGPFEAQVMLLGLLAMVVQVFDFRRGLEQCRVVDVQPEGPVQITLAGNEAHQFGRAVMGGLEHGLFAQWVGQQYAGMQSRHDAVTHGHHGMRLNQPDQVP
jgi:hypothetical protein